jgi:hypothetical protein
MEALTLIGASAPTTLVYEYGFRPDPECCDLIHEQMFKKTKLFNEIVAQCRLINESARNWLMALAGPETQVMQTAIAGHNEAFASAKAAGDEARMKVVAQARREAYAQMKAILKPLRTQHAATLKEQYYGRIGSNAHHETYKIMRAAIEQGLGAETAHSTLTDALKSNQKSLAKGGLPQGIPFLAIAKNATKKLHCIGACHFNGESFPPQFGCVALQSQPG